MVRNALILVAAGVLSSCSADGAIVPGTGPPVTSAAPTAVPATGASDGATGCLVREDQPSSGRDAVGVVTVDPDPEGATLLWLPGRTSTSTSTRCAAQLTSLAAPAAVGLARDILAAPAVSPGRYNCPADDGAAVAVYLRYAHRTDDEVVEIPLSGCAFLDAPGRIARQQTPGIRGDLRAVAPPDWVPYLKDR